MGGGELDDRTVPGGHRLFHLVGVDQPAAFPQPWTPELLTHLKVTPSSAGGRIDVMRQLLAEAQRQGREPIVRVLSQALDRIAAEKRQQEFREFIRCKISEPYRQKRRALRSAIKARWQRWTGKTVKPGAVTLWVSALMAIS